MIRIEDHAGLTDEQRAWLVGELAGLATLEDVLRWGHACRAAHESASVMGVVGVVVQDEFSHDVVMTGPSGLYLCFDTT